MALRFIPASISDAEIRKNVRFVTENGFINYYGMQRFGTYNIRTHTLGKEILK